ncbi:MAG: hypothetical protein ACE5D0_10025 [Fidelibacterota bacterium]
MDKKNIKSHLQRHIVSLQKSKHIARQIAKVDPNEADQSSIARLVDIQEKAHAELAYWLALAVEIQSKPRNPNDFTLQHCENNIASMMELIALNSGVLHKILHSPKFAHLIPKN